MFERYTEKARRAIFFARYEASQYGSRIIETEHLLLGILRADKMLAGSLFPVPGAMETLCEEIESQLKQGPRISTSVAMPLSQESKQILNLASESAEKLGHRYVECFHLILGTLRVEKCKAARLLLAHNVDEKKVEAATSESYRSAAMEIRAVRGEELQAARREELQKTVAQVISLWAAHDAGLVRWFAEDAQFSDSRGTIWSGAGLEKGIEAQFAAPGVEYEGVTVENIRNLSMGSAVVILRMAVKGSPAQQLVLVFRYGPLNWQIVSGHSSLLETP